MIETKEEKNKNKSNDAIGKYSIKIKLKCISDQLIHHQPNEFIANVKLTVNDYRFELVWKSASEFIFYNIKLHVLFSLNY